MRQPTSQTNIVRDWRFGLQRHIDDAVAMVGSMGQERVYNVTLLEESSGRPLGAPEGSQQEEEEAAGDFDDPVVMMGG
eukprot:8410650-Lingulodinium_polyedra.AAC.1